MKKTLFVVDYINGIAKTGSCGDYLRTHPEVIQNTNKIISLFREFSLPIVFIRLAFDENHDDLPKYAPSASSMKQHKKFILGI